MESLIMIKVLQPRSLEHQLHVPTLFINARDYTTLAGMYKQAG